MFRSNKVWIYKHSMFWITAILNHIATGSAAVKAGSAYYNAAQISNSTVRMGFVGVHNGAGLIKHSF